MRGEKGRKKWDIAGKVHGDDPYALYHWWLRQIGEIKGGIFLIGEAGYENMLTWSINGYDYSIVGFISLEEMKKMLEVNQ